MGGVGEEEEDGREGERGGKMRCMEWRRKWCSKEVDKIGRRVRKEKGVKGSVRVRGGFRGV